VPYRAALTRSFLRELRKLPDDVKSRVLEAVNSILANPFSRVKLRGELEGYWRWRVSKYRIVCARGRVKLPKGLVSPETCF
jgi:mRNA-degrading endonuclease RelE of RelBE toxin-antitoxin system